MATFKGTVFFEWGQQGWSETWYLDSDDKKKALSKLAGYVTQRRKSLAKSASVSHIRVSNPDSTRDALFDSYPADTGLGRSALSLAPIDDEVTTAAINMRYSTLLGTAWKNVLVRGLPRGAITHQDFPVVEPAWLLEYKNTVDYVKAQNFRHKKVVYGNPATVTAATVIAFKMQDITTAGAIPALDGATDLIQLRFFSGISNANGLWRIRLAAAGFLYFLKEKIQKNKGLVPGGQAQARFVKYDYSEGYDDAVAVAVTSRRTGRPSYLPRGRRPVNRG